MRRVSLSLLVSLGLHLALVATALGVAAWRGLSFAKNVELVPITLESVHELPLGPPPAAVTTPSQEVVAPPPRPRPKLLAHKSGTLPTERDAGAPPEPKPAPPVVARPGPARAI